MRSIILGIESSDEFLSVGLAGPESLIISRSSEPGTHNKNILHRFLSDVIAEAGVKMADIAGVAVAIGPGSFTGLRVGLAVAKGICWSLGLPLAGISSLLAIAHCAPADLARFVAVKDAKRSEFYYAAFERGANGIVQVVPDSVAAPDIVLKLASDGFTLLGPGVEALSKYADGMKLYLSNRYDRQMLGGAIAMLGRDRISAGETLDIAESAPVYIRVPRPAGWNS